jgi:hypothetical protein
MCVSSRAYTHTHTHTHTHNEPLERSSAAARRTTALGDARRTADEARGVSLGLIFSLSEEEEEEEEEDDDDDDDDEGGGEGEGGEIEESTVFA